MKQSDITLKVIELSKKISKHWRMEIYEGCWYVEGDSNEPKLFPRGDGLFKDGKKIRVFEEAVDYFPIPSIADCLGELRKKYKSLQQNWKDDNVLNFHISVSKFHEWSLSALLEILKKEKGE